MKLKFFYFLSLLIVTNMLSAQTFNAATIVENSVDNSMMVSNTRNSKAVYPAKAYAINSTDRKFESIDLSNGVVTMIGDIPTTGMPVALAFVDSTLYCLSIGSSNDMVIISPNGTFSTAGSITGLPDMTTTGTIPVALAYDYTSETTYLSTISFFSGISTLYSLNMTTLAATSIGSIINKDIYSIEIDNEGNMFAICTTNDSIYQVNKGTGLGTPVGAIGVGLDDNSQNMAWNFTDSTLFGILYDDAGDGKFGSINTSSGLFSEVANYSAKQYSGFAINKYYVSTTSIETIENANLKIYPNPASDFVFVNAGNEFSKITIADMSGKIILEQAIFGEAQICVSSLNSGVYFVTLSNSDHFACAKLLIN